MSRVEQQSGPSTDNALTMLPKGSDTEAARSWLRLICRRFGLGFHLDTPASEYVMDDGTRLDAEVAAALDDSIERAFALLGPVEPYDICVAEFQQIAAMSSTGAL
ncbi:MAG: hypothetical protein WBC44_10110 [Planctomycetaceae bacterium]